MHSQRPLQKDEKHSQTVLNGGANYSVHDMQESARMEVEDATLRKLAKILVEAYLKKKKYEPLKQ